MDYLYVKALHIIFVVTWFAGLFYIPRLFNEQTAVVHYYLAVCHSCEYFWNLVNLPESSLVRATLDARKTSLRFSAILLPWFLSKYLQ
jgi:uncharacterized membrane protein